MFSYKIELNKNKISMKIKQTFIKKKKIQRRVSCKAPVSQIYNHTVDNLLNVILLW